MMERDGPREAVTGKPAIVRLAFAVGIGVLLVLHAMARSPSQLLWACHEASLIIAIGLVLDLPRLIAVGVLFHASLGIPVYALDLIFRGETSITSVLLHTLPLAAGASVLWGRPLPHGILLPAWLIQPASMIAAYLLTDPALNVMLVHERYGPTASWFSTLWIAWLS